MSILINYKPYCITNISSITSSRIIAGNQIISSSKSYGYNPTPIANGIRDGWGDSPYIGSSTNNSNNYSTFCQFYC